MRNIACSLAFVYMSFNFIVACGPRSEEAALPVLGPQDGLQLRLPAPRACPGQDELACYALSMPLDHKNPGAEGITVRFAVRPASMPSSEALLVLFGGPGDPSVHSLRAWLQRIKPELKQRFHIITMDLRGVDGSEAMDCPRAAYDFSFVPPWTYTAEETQALAAGAQAAANACVQELGRSPEELQHFNSRQAAADLEAFRRLMGFEAWSIYALSYGTQLAQTYINAYPGHTRSLVLDGAVDLSANLLDYARDLALAQNMIFEDLDPYCQSNAECRAAFTVGSRNKAAQVTLPSAAYDSLFRRLKQEGAAIRYLAPDGSPVLSHMTGG